MCIIVLTGAVKGGILSTFKNLDITKQDKIINAAMYVFATHGYKKSYMSEIAKRAEISKPTLFYHFGTKLELYTYLLDIATSEIIQSIDNQEVINERDFFECLKVSSSLKMKALARRPSLMKFLTKFYFETEDCVVALQEEYLKQSEKMRSKLLFDDLDVSKFKPSVKPQLVMDMLLKWTEGYIAILEKSTIHSSDEDIAHFYDKMIEEFLELIEMLRLNFYEQEYL